MTDGPTDRRTDRQTDRPTYLIIEAPYRSLKTQAVELLLGETSLLLSLGQAPTPVKLGSEMLF